MLINAFSSFSVTSVPLSTEASTSDARCSISCLPSANAFRVSVMLFPISSTATATSVNLFLVFSRITFVVKTEFAPTMIITTIYTTAAYVPFLYKKPTCIFYFYCSEYLSVFISLFCGFYSFIALSVSKSISLFLS